MHFEVLPTLPTYREIGNTVFFNTFIEVISSNINQDIPVLSSLRTSTTTISFISFHTKYSASITKFGKNVVFIIAKTPNH